LRIAWGSCVPSSPAPPAHRCGASDGARQCGPLSSAGRSRAAGA
jgi:hypothetical protein